MRNRLYGQCVVCGLFAEDPIPEDLGGVLHQDVDFGEHPHWVDENIKYSSSDQSYLIGRRYAETGDERYTNLPFVDVSTMDFDEGVKEVDAERQFVL